MNKWIVILIMIGLVVLFVYLKLHWQQISIMLVAALGPLRFFSNFFGESNDSIKKKHEKIRQEESNFQDSLEASVGQKKQEIDFLHKKINSIDKKILDLEERENNVDIEVNSMSIEELQAAGTHYFGD